MKVQMHQKGGIVFFQTKILDELTSFYIDQVGCSLWLDQGGCRIFQFGNMLFGLCQREQIDHMGMITFFYSSKEEVDKIYQKMKKRAMAEPAENSLYRIYHFYAKDPEGRNIEFQYFWDDEVK